MNEVLSVPALVPGLLVSLVAAAVLGRRVGDVLGALPFAGMLLVVGVGLALSATLSPSAEAITQGLRGSGTCDLGRVGMASANQLARGGEVALNVLMLLPLGVAVGLLPHRRSSLVVLAAVAVLPFAVELVQLVVTRLGRECQSGDVIDNLTGLALGAFGTTAIGWGRTAVSDRSAVRTAGRLGGLATVGCVAILVILASPDAPAVPAITPVPTQRIAPTAEVTGESTRVDSIEALLEALADDQIGDIVVIDGTYQVSTAATQAADSLWIGARFAGRSNPVTVRAETPGGVTFDGGGASTFGGISFEEGAHDQTWDGFVFASGEPTQTGVITFGGYAGLAAPHHITMRNITLSASLVSDAPGATDHGVYVSRAIGGPHDLLFENFTVDGSGGLSSAFQFYGSEAGNPNAWNVTIRGLSVVGTGQAIILWDPTLHDITIDTATIENARDVAVRYESPGARNIVLANIRSTGSGSGQGFHSSLGNEPDGITFVSNSFR